MLEKLKTIWRAAGLNCGTCSTCIEKNECERAHLHKFRSTYGTMMLRKYDISTVRKLMGHKPGSEATFRYLAPMLHEELRRKGVYSVFENVMQWDYGPRVISKSFLRQSGDLDLESDLVVRLENLSLRHESCVRNDLRSLSE